MILKVFSVLLVLSVAQLAKAGEKHDNSKTLTDIKATLGSVPTFLKEFPAEGIAGAWEEFKNVQLNPSSTLTGKEKELIGLAISAQIPCRFCTYFHRKAAAFNGADKEEMNEAVSIAAIARKWSTFFHGSQLELSSFQADVDKMVSQAKDKIEKAAKGKQIESKPPVDVVDAATAYKDMENIFGFVPGFIKKYPENAVAGAWNEMKMIEMNPNTALPGRTKSLISLAVASQVPCTYCIYADTEFAKLDGATPAQIQETIVLAGIIRHWSTFINGLQQDERAFQREVDQIFKFLEKGKAGKNMKVSAKEH